MKEQKKYYVYRFKNQENIIVYVGRTSNLALRFKQHDALTSDVIKIEYIECSSEAEMAWKEIYYINLYYNKLSRNISDVYQNDNMKDIGLKDKWKEYIYNSNIANTSLDQLEILYKEYVSNNFQQKYKELITIIDHKKLNSIGDDVYSLSEKWFKNEPKQVKQLKNNILNYYMNIIKDNDKNKKCLWTTYMPYFNNLKGKGYTKGFYYKNNTDYKDKIYLAYLENNFMNNGQLGNLTQDQYALTCLLQFIFSSGIVNKKHITIYIPSRRMRELLINWIEEEKYEEAHPEEFD